MTAYERVLAMTQAGASDILFYSRDGNPETVLRVRLNQGADFRVQPLIQDVEAVIDGVIMISLGHILACVDINTFDLVGVWRPPPEGTSSVTASVTSVTVDNSAIYTMQNPTLSLSRLAVSCGSDWPTQS
jgi:hypothetical protein